MFRDKPSLLLEDSKTKDAVLFFFFFVFTSGLFCSYKTTSKREKASHHNKPIVETALNDEPLNESSSVLTTHHHCRCCCFCSTFPVSSCPHLSDQGVRSPSAWPPRPPSRRQSGIAQPCSMSVCQWYVYTVWCSALNVFLVESKYRCWVCC